MYADELRSLRRKLEEKRGEIKGYTVLDTVDVPLNSLELEFIVKSLSFIDRRK